MHNAGGVRAKVRTCAHARTRTQALLCTTRHALVCFGRPPPHEPRGLPTCRRACIWCKPSCTRSAHDASALTMHARPHLQVHVDGAVEAARPAGAHAVLLHRGRRNRLWCACKGGVHLCGCARIVGPTRRGVCVPVVCVHLSHHDKQAGCAVFHTAMCPLSLRGLCTPMCLCVPSALPLAPCHSHCTGAQMRL